MNSDRQQEDPEYLVTCFTPGCTWQQERETYQDAQAAGKQHQAEHALHITHVFPPEESQRAA
jgi:hypothetical protein